MSYKAIQSNNSKLDETLPKDHHVAVDETKILADEYLQGPCLVESGTGDIFAAWEKDAESGLTQDPLNPPLYIKYIPDSYPQSAEAMQILEEEVQRVKSGCDSFGILSLEHDNEHAFLVMDLPHGDFVINKLVPGKRFGNLPSVLDFIRKISIALNKLKSCGMKHGRVGMDSLYMTEDGEIVLLDNPYVSAKHRQIENDIDCTTTVPNRDASYASPDACFGREISEADDVFALSSIAYHLLSGQHPFGDSNSVSALLNKVRPQKIASLSESQWHHLERGMALQKENRLATIDAFVNGFETANNPVKIEIQQQKSKPKSKPKSIDTGFKLTPEQQKQNELFRSTPSAEHVAKRVKLPRSLPKQKKSFDFSAIEFPSWSWIPLSMIMGFLAGAMLTGIAIEFFDLNTRPFQEFLHNLF